MRLPKVVCLLFLAGGLSAETLVNRRVLLVNFVNQNKSSAAEYLSITVPESLIGPLQKTGSFEILSRDLAINTAKKLGIAEADLFTDANAIALGKATGAEVVVIGNYVVIQNTVQIQTKAIDSESGRVKASQSIVGKTDGSIFDTIGKLALLMSADMKQNLPPIPQREVIREKTVYRDGESKEAVQEKIRSSWFFGFGAGAGVLLPDTNLGGTEVNTSPGPLVVLSGGKTLLPQLLVGLSIFGGKTFASKQLNTSTGGSGGTQQTDIPFSVSHLDNFATVSYFPFGSGLNVRGGLGLSWMQYATSGTSTSAATAAGITSTNGSRVGFSGLLQAGYAFWLGKSFNLGINTAVIFSSADTGAANRILLFVTGEWF